jgi:hypothetical protein
MVAELPRHDRQYQVAERTSAAFDPLDVVQHRGDEQGSAV